MLRRVAGWAKLGAYWLRGRTVGPAEYADAYDAVAATYDRWTERMGRHTQHMVARALVAVDRPEPRVLDLACGTGCASRAALPRAGSVLGIDRSPAMIERARAELNDPRVMFQVADGLEFVADAAPGSFDAVLCGWGLVYFPHTKLLPELRRVLAPGGVVGVIMNAQGTLRGVEPAFMAVMSAQPAAVRRVMDIRFALPAGERGLRRWFERQGFGTVETGQGEEIMDCASPGELLCWLRQTGALAGTEQIFVNSAAVEPLLIEAIGRRCRHGDRWQSNHRFVWGVFRRAEVG